MTEAPHTSLTYQDGLQSASGVSFGESEFACFDFFIVCFDWVVTPTTDPLYFFPSNPSLAFYETPQDLQQIYLDNGLSTIEENTLVVVVGFTIGGVPILTKDLSKVGGIQYFYK